MRRVLFRWGPVPVYSYPAMLYLGTVCGIYAQLYAASLIPLNTARTLAATLLLLIAGLIGARLLFVATHWSSYRHDPGRIWRPSEGGAAMYGGLLLAAPVSVPVLAALSLPIGAFWDTASFTMLIGMIVTRAGCLLNGCCAGRLSEGWLALNLPDCQGVWKRRVPTQILEAAWGLAILAGAVALRGRLPFSGALFLYTVAAYGAGRIVLEFTRATPDRLGRFTVHGAISAALVGAALTAFVCVVWT